MKLFIRYLLLVVLILLAAGQLFAKGTIEGVILDQKTGEPLIGASISMKHHGVVAVSDMDGRFTIPSIPDDTVLLTAQYVSYASQILPPMILSTDTTIQLKIEMAEAAIELKGVQVVGYRRVNNTLAMLENTKKSWLIINGISAQQIQRSIDRDAGEVVRRMPGITVQDQRFIIVRGLNERYNQVWLNGGSIPSSETDSRAFSFDAIPGSVMENLTVYKTPAPELPADFSGGFIKIQTKSIPDEKSISLQLSTGYQAETTGRSLYLKDQSLSDWFGFGSASRALPANLPDKIKTSQPVAERASYARSLNGKWVPERLTALRPSAFPIH
jgi:hypothetical protein